MLKSTPHTNSYEWQFGGHLVEGDLAARTVRTVVENVECPSLSPEGARIAFKQAVDGDRRRGGGCRCWTWRRCG